MSARVLQRLNKWFAIQGQMQAQHNTHLENQCIGTHGVYARAPGGGPAKLPRNRVPSTTRATSAVSSWWLEPDPCNRRVQVTDQHPAEPSRNLALRHSVEDVTTAASRLEHWESMHISLPGGIARMPSVDCRIVPDDWPSSGPAHPAARLLARPVPFHEVPPGAANIPLRWDSTAG